MLPETPRSAHADSLLDRDVGTYLGRGPVGPRLAVPLPAEFPAQAQAGISSSEHLATESVVSADGLAGASPPQVTEH